MEAKSQLFVLWVAALLRTANGLENAIFVRKSNSTLSSKELKILGFEENHIVNTIQDAQTILRKMSKKKMIASFILRVENTTCIVQMHSC